MVKRVYSKQQRYRMAKQSEGYVLKQLWIHADCLDEVLAFIEQRDKQRLADSQQLNKRQLASR